MYRDALAAAQRRAEALDRELARLRLDRTADQSRIVELENQVSAAYDEVQRAYRLAVGPAAGAAPRLPPSDATTVLVLGILSLVACTLLGPVAWHMGNATLDRMARGEVSPTKRGEAVAGKVCGVIGTVMFGITIVMLLIFFTGAPR